MFKIILFFGGKPIKVGKLLKFVNKINEFIFFINNHIPFV